MPSIVLNDHNITAAAARLGLINITHAVGMPITCELLARLQQLLEVDLATLASIASELETDVSGRHTRDSYEPQRGTG